MILCSHVWINIKDEVYMHILAVIAEKGGVGKTTAVTNLAVAFTQQGFATGVIDLDKQVTATNWVDRREDTLPMVVPAFESRLDHEVERMRNDGCEVLILDTAPHADSIAQAAAKKADYSLVVTQPSINEIETIEKTLELVMAVNKNIIVLLNEVTPPKIKNDEVIHTKETLEAFEYLNSQKGVAVCPTPWARRVAFKRAPVHGLGVLEYAEKDDRALLEIKHVHMFICEHMNIVKKGVANHGKD